MKRDTWDSGRCKAGLGIYLNISSSFTAQNPKCQILWDRFACCSLLWHPRMDSSPAISLSRSLPLSLSILFHFLRFLFWLSFSVFLGDRMRKECRKLESKIFSWKRYFLARKRETKIFSWKFWSKLGQNPR